MTLNAPSESGRARHRGTGRARRAGLPTETGVEPQLYAEVAEAPVNEFAARYAGLPESD